MVVWVLLVAMLHLRMVEMAEAVYAILYLLTLVVVLLVGSAVAEVVAAKEIPVGELVE